MRNVVLFHLTGSPLAIQTSAEPGDRDGGYLLIREIIYSSDDHGNRGNKSPTTKVLVRASFLTLSL